jgi:opacity protein-like surface antigen
MSRIFLLTAASVFGLIASASVAKADGQPPAFVGSAPFTWSGMYIGYQSGAAWGEMRVSDPFGPSVFGDKIHTPGSFAGGVIGFNWQIGSAVFGVEADANWADIEGTNTCYAASGFTVSSNCRAHTDAFGTLTGRLGFAVGSTGRSLLYVKGGAAWEDRSIDTTLNSALGPFPPIVSPASASSSETTWGWTVGAGVEHAFLGGWSMKAEYDYLNFGSTNINTPAGLTQIGPFTFLVTPGVTAKASDDEHIFKLGMNYRFGGAPDGGSIREPAYAGVSGIEFEFGARYVYGWGRFQKDLGVAGVGVNGLASRLTYDDMNTNGGELLARLDTRQNFMFKGLVGFGSGNDGKMNDEDWFLPGVPFIAYSNTLSSADDRITYGTIDAGYDWLRGSGYKAASFVGYNVFSQNMKAFGCAQLASPFSDCVPPIPTSVLGITEKDTWQSIRLGSAADFYVLPRVKVSADVAYLPYVWFDGTDNHVLRSLVSPENGHGQGVQVDLTVSYAVTDQFSLGVGGRYWSMFTTSGETNFGGSGIFVPQRFAVEQAAVLVQGSYRFGGDSCCAGPLK